MTFTHNVIIFCFSICLTSCITASKSSDLDYLTSLLNDQNDESEAIDGTFRNINFKKKSTPLFYRLVYGYIDHLVAQ